MKLRIKIPEETKTLWRSLWHNRWLRYSVYALGITIPLGIYAAALISIPHTFTGGQLVRAGEVNTNFKTLYDTLGITEAQGLTVGANIEAQGFTLNGTPVGSSSDSFWSVAGSPNIAYNSGNVGIGITPTTKFHVNGTTTLAGATAINGDTIMKGSTSATGAAALDVQNSGATSMFYVGNGGNVGIGTTSPAERLEINGNLKFTSVGQKIAFLNNGATTNDIYVPTGTGRTVFETPGSIQIYLDADNNNVGSHFQIFHNGTHNAGTSLFKVQDDGNVGIGTTNPTSAKLVVNGSIWSSDGSPLTGSDIRWKKNIKKIDNSLDRILKVRGVLFNWRESEFPDMNFSSSQQIGLIAQELEKQFPAIVRTNPKTGFKSVAYASMVAPLIEAIKELKEEKDRQLLEKENKIKQLEAALASQNARLDRIERMMARAN